MRKTSWIRAVAALAALAIAAAACGGDNDAIDDGATTTAAPEAADTSEAAEDSSDELTFEELVEQEEAEPEAEAGAEPEAEAAAAETVEPEDDTPDGVTAEADAAAAETVEPEEVDEPEPVDICDTATPEAVETGVTAEEIIVVVAADVDTPLAPGLFQGAFDGVDAWAEHVNATGGLACRQVRVEQFDTVLNPNESVNAQLFACENALAMVGTTALFVFDVTALNSCPDSEGNGIGLPDIAQLTTEVGHQCSANTFAVIAPQGACPFTGGERRYGERVGHIRWFQENIDPDLLGVFLVPADLPSTRVTAVTTVQAAVEGLGIESVGEWGISGNDLQPVYAEFVQAIADSGANYARTGSDLRSLVKFRSEAAAQGVDVEIWECTIACYDQAIFETGGGVEDGTYITIFQIPFEEAYTNAELQAFVDGMDGNPSAFASNAWASGVLLQDAINDIIDETGDINAITRANVLDALKRIDSFDAHGMIGATNPVAGVGNDCFVLLQIQGQEFVRIHPAEAGTMDCDPANKVEITMDAAAYVNDHLK